MSIQYGIALVALTKSRRLDQLPRIHQRYFDEYEENEQGLTIKVRLLNGEWKEVNRTAVVRWPVRERQTKEEAK